MGGSKFQVCQRAPQCSTVPLENYCVSLLAYENKAELMQCEHRHNAVYGERTKKAQHRETLKYSGRWRSS